MKKLLIILMLLALAMPVIAKDAPEKNKAKDQPKAGAPTKPAPKDDAKKAEEEEEDVSIDDNSALLAIAAEAQDTEPVSVDTSFEAINEVGSSVVGSAESEQTAVAVRPLR